jgi:hypothetical protein
MMYLEKIQNRRAKGNGGRKYLYGEQWLTTTEIGKEAGKPFSSVKDIMTRYGITPIEAVKRIREKNART